MTLDGWIDLSGSTGTGAGIDLQNASTYTTVLIEWSAGVSAGAVMIETAMSTSLTATWAQLAVVAFAGTPPRMDVVQIQGTLHALRTRITTTVVGGTVLTRIFSRN